MPPRDPPPTDTGSTRYARYFLVTWMVALGGVVRVGERYLPAYLDALGSGAVAIGALGSLALASHLGYLLVDSRSVSTREVALLATVAASVGLLAWAGAPNVGALLDVLLPATLAIALGVGLVQAWHAYRPAVETILDVDVVSGAVEPGDGRRARVPESGADPRPWTGLWALGTATIAAKTTVAVAATGAVPAGFALLAVAGAAAGIAGTVAIRVLPARPSVEASDPHPAGVPGTPRAALAAIRDAFASVPAPRRRLVVGDAAVRAATAMTSLLVAVLVVDDRGVGIRLAPTPFGVDPSPLAAGAIVLPPVAALGAFAGVEALGAFAGARVAPRVGGGSRDRETLIAGLGVVSLLPVAFVAAPAAGAAFAALFGLLGARTAIEPIRPTLGAAGDLPAAVPLAVRTALVPAPLVGGVLYAVEPTLAFTLATVVGALGVREATRAPGAGEAERSLGGGRA